MTRISDRKGSAITPPPSQGVGQAAPPTNPPPVGTVFEVSPEHRHLSPERTPRPPRRCCSRPRSPEAGRRRLALMKAEVGSGVRPRSRDVVHQGTGPSNTRADLVGVSRRGASIEVDSVHRQAARAGLLDGVPGDRSAQRTAHRRGAAATRRARYRSCCTGGSGSGDAHRHRAQARVLDLQPGPRCGPESATPETPSCLFTNVPVGPRAGRLDDQDEHADRVRNEFPLMSYVRLRRGRLR